MKSVPQSPSTSPNLKSISRNLKSISRNLKIISQNLKSISRLVYYLWHSNKHLIEDLKRTYMAQSLEYDTVWRTTVTRGVI